MPTHISNINQTLILNNKRVVGLADDDSPVKLPDVESAKAVYGQDGTMYTHTTGMQGGEVSVMLLPTSRTAKEWLRDYARQLAGAVIVWRGSYGDNNLGYSTELLGGLMTKAPVGITPGSILTFMFQFEQLIPNYDNARFGRSPIAL